MGSLRAQSKIIRNGVHWRMVFSFLENGCRSTPLFLHFIHHNIFTFLLLVLGHCRIHQKGIRQKIQPHLALHCWPKFWLICNTRNSTFHLLLPRPSCYFTLQKWIDKTYSHKHIQSKYAHCELSIILKNNPFH